MAKKKKEKQQVAEDIIVAAVEQVFEEPQEKLDAQILEEVQEEVVEQVTVQAKEKLTNEVKVERVIQKQPRGYKLLLEDGRTVKVSKDKFNKIKKTVTL